MLSLPLMNGTVFRTKVFPRCLEWNVDPKNAKKKTKTKTKRPCLPVKLHALFDLLHSDVSAGRTSLKRLEKKCCIKKVDFFSQSRKLMLRRQ